MHNAQFLTFMEDPANKTLRDEVVALLGQHTNVATVEYEMSMIADSFAPELKVCGCCAYSVCCSAWF